MPKPYTILTTALLLLAALLVSTAADAQSPEPSGRVSIESTSIAAGIGLSWGHGTLLYSGKEFHFSIDGVTLLDFGFSKANSAGEVYNLADLASFNGTYFATEASFALGGGMGGASLRNQHGVVLRLNSVSQGARLQFGSSGMSITLWQ
jgi:hypothetical protein